jgi:hypothetical protein
MKKFKLSEIQALAIVEMARKVRSSEGLEVTHMEDHPQEMMDSITKKAEEVIAEARVSQTLEGDMSVATAIAEAEADLQESVDMPDDESMKFEKATSALRKAKEAKLMIHRPGRSFFKNGIQNHDDDAWNPPFDEDTEDNSPESSTSSSSSSSSFEEASSSESSEESDTTTSASSSLSSSVEGTTPSESESSSSNASTSMSAESENGETHEEDEKKKHSKKDEKKEMEDTWKKIMKNL